MIRNGSYGEWADQMIAEVRNGEHLHGGSFENLLNYDAHNAARVYIEFAERFGPFVTAAQFALQCDWNSEEDACTFVDSNPSWPPQRLEDELRYF
ncbi:MAG: hypothetical protein WAS36_01350 [Candidatus Saccharimonadales bacterium]